MKRILFFAALVLGMVSCMKDQSFEAGLVGDGNFVLSVALPDNATRAAGNDSALGAVDNGILNEYDVRYTLEVYDVNDQLAKRDQHTVNSDKTSFELRLVPGRHYRFVVWADFVKAGVDPYYNVANLREVSLTGTHNAMNESRDAYTAVFNTETDGDGKTFSSASKIAMTLTRPFAKLRVVTNDMNEIYSELKSATVTYTTPIYTGFNALNAEVTGATASNVVKTVDFTNAAYKYDGEPTTEGEQTLFADYLFGTEDGTVMFTLNVEDAVAAIPTITFNTTIPVQRNHLTTILGPVLTDANEVSVKIEDAFAAENIIIEGDYTLTADMEVNRPIVVLAGTEAVIDLNGFDIINTNASETFGEGEGIIAYGNLTIKGEGTVKGSTMAVWARGNKNATITIEGGNFEGCAEGFAKGGRSVVYASSGNVIDIYGGTFKALAADKTSYANKTEGVYAALNVADNNGMINVYGGSFYKQNPAAPGTEPAAWNANHPNGFLAEGCVVEADGDWFKVKYDPYYYHTKVSTADELTEALANSQSKIYLAAGKVFEGTFAPKVNTEFVSDSENKATIKGRVNTKSFDISFENIKFACLAGHSDKAWVGAGATAKGHEAIVMIENAASSFENCNFDIDATYVACAINNHSAAEDSDKLTVNNCTFAGNMYAIKTRTHFNITNSTFDIDGPDFTIYSVFTWGVGFPASAVFSNNRNLSGADDFIGGVEFSSKTHGADIYNNLTIIMNGNSDFIKDAGFNTTYLNFTNSTYNGVAIK